MKFDVPKVVRPIPLKEYAAEFGETCLQVWINPDKLTRKERLDLQVENLEKNQADLKAYAAQVEAAKKENKPAPEMPELAERLWFTNWKRRWVDWLSRIWSQGADESHLSVAQILELEEKDPYLVRWLVDRTLAMVDDLKKASPPA
jgi:hypothetical protein